MRNDSFACLYSFHPKLGPPIVHYGHMGSMIFMGRQFAAAVRPLLALFFALMTVDFFEEVSPQQK